MKIIAVALPALLLGLNMLAWREAEHRGYQHGVQHGLCCASHVTCNGRESENCTRLAELCGNYWNEDCAK